MSHGGRARQDDEPGAGTQFEGVKSEAFDGGDIGCARTTTLFKECIRSFGTLVPGKFDEEGTAEGLERRRRRFYLKRATRLCRPPARWTVRGGRDAAPDRHASDKTKQSRLSALETRGLTRFALLAMKACLWGIQGPSQKLQTNSLSRLNWRLLYGMLMFSDWRAASR